MTTAPMALALALCAGTATATPTAFVSNGDTLYRGWGDSYESFEMSDAMTSMAFDSDGRLWTTSYLHNRLGLHQLYEVMDFDTDSPWLREVGVGLLNNTTSIEFIQDDVGREVMVGWQDDGNMYSIDRGTGLATILGATGDVMSSGFDAVTGQVLAVQNGNPGMFFRASVNIPGDGIGDSAIALTQADPTGVNMGTSGGAFLDGTFWQAYFDAGVLRIGTIGEDGLFSLDHVVDEGLAQSSTGFALLVPTPASAVMLVAGAGLATRRRR